ncbi:MAG TPA: methyltransferase domain-containing protein [Angustibacter sp.]|nr:methyltransferase domain-containing protein [Angustibacter sp.]
MSEPAGREPGSRLGVDEAIAFWDERHQRAGELLSGGDMTYDHATNEAFYALRLGRLLDIVGTSVSQVAPLRLLDAGCGKGWFSRALARCGHRVDGIDSSVAAIEECRRLAVGTERYEVSRLDTWAPPYLYDAVVTVDVLFHLMDDDLWRASVVNLASLVRFGGLLALADHDAPADHLWGAYQVTRSRGAYLDLVPPLGLQYEGFEPYRFRDNAAGFHVFRRVA